MPDTDQIEAPPVDEAEVPAEKKKTTGKPKTKTPDPLAPGMAAHLARAGAASDPGLGIGDIVIFTPTRAAHDSLRSARGVDVTGWAAMVTYIRPDGAYHLRVFRPFGLSDETVQAAVYDPNGAPGTFRLKD